MGSRPYMAPERLDGASDTPAVDIYSAGMSLLELLTGRVANLSINPTHHQRGLADGLREVAPDGVPLEALPDLRELLRRMCAYDAKERPTARDVAIQLERLIERLDPAHRIGLEQYARDAVEPLYAGRGRRGLQDIADAELITGVFGGEEFRPLQGRQLGRRPAVFLGAVAGMVLGSGLVATQKALRADAPPAGTGVVRVWMPADAQARIGMESLAVPGRIVTALGASELVLLFEDGKALGCPFDVRPVTTVRYVVERGSGAISVDDGPAIPCRELGGSSSE